MVIVSFSVCLRKNQRVGGKTTSGSAQSRTEEGGGGGGGVLAGVDRQKSVILVKKTFVCLVEFVIFIHFSIGSHCLECDLYVSVRCGVPLSGHEHFSPPHVIW